LSISVSARAGRLAFAVGLVAVASAISLATFFAVAGGPFGAVNDIGNGILAALSAALAWTLRSRVPALALVAALLGALIAAVGSWLAQSDLVGFFFAGLVSSVGFASIGVWVVVLNRTGDSEAGWPPGLAGLGIAAGVVMAVGLATLPGIVMGVDDMATAPGWIWIGYLGWFGIYLLYPAWAIWFGRSTENALGGKETRAAIHG
jgi:hypothetical protein